MSLSFGGGYGQAGKTSLLDRAVNNLSDTAKGFFPGMLHIGGTIGSDVVNVATGKKRPFQIDNLGMDMAKGFAQNSFLPPLLLGHPGEALHRASQRPLDALLDASMVFPAYSGTAKLAASTGALTKSAPMLEWGTKAQGLVKAPAEIQASLRNIMETKAGSGLHDPTLPMTVADLPASFEVGGEKLLGREWLQDPTSVKSYGGDLYLRRAQRSIPWGPATKTGDGGEAEIMDSANASSSLMNPVGTLRDDPYRELTTYRAKNPLLAQAGDSFHNVVASSPRLNRFTSKRLGKKMVQNNIQNLRTDHDDALIATNRLLDDFYKEVTAQEGFADLPRESFNQLVADKTFLRSAGFDVDDVAGAIERLNPEIAYNTLDAQGILDMSPADMMASGLRFDIDHSDGHLSINPEDYATVRDFYNSHENDFFSKNEEGAVRPKVKIQALSENHLTALRDHSSSKMQAVNELARLDDLARRNFHTPMISRNGELSRISDFGDQGALLEALYKDPETKLELHPDEKLYKAMSDVKDQMILEMDDAPHASGKAWIKDDLSANMAAFNEAFSQYKRRNAELQNYEKYSAHHLSNDGLFNKGEVIGDPLSTAPGLIDQLKQIQRNEHLKNVNFDGQAATSLFSYLDELAKRGGDKAQQSLSIDGKSMLTEDRLAENQMRTRDMLDAKGEMDVTDPSFYPMLKKKHENDTLTSLKRREHDVAPEMTVLDSSAGDPHAMLLSGDFRVDHNVLLDYYRRESENLAGTKLFQQLKDMSYKVSGDELKKLRKSGHLTTSKDFREGRNPKNFIEVQRNDFLNEEVREMIRNNDTLAAGSRSAGDMESALAFEENSKLLRGMQIGPDDIALTDKRMDIHIAKKIDTDEAYVVPTELYAGALDELKKAQAAMGSLYMSIQNGWKFMVLHTRFASWMRNNLIGAHLMAAMSRGPINYLNHLIKSFDPKYKAAFDAFDDPRNADVLQSGSASIVRSNAIVNADPSQMNSFERGMHKIDNVKGVFSDFNAKWADDPMRKFHMMDQMLDQVKLMENQLGRKIDITPDLVNKFLEDDVLRSEMARRTGIDLVDFGDIGESEKKWLATVFPFWSWMKGSTKAAQRIAADKPGSVIAAAAIGEAGAERTHEQHGKFVPEFAKEMFDPGEAGGFTINTAGFNPFMTPIDFMTTGAGLVPDIIPGDSTNAMHYNNYGSENLISNMNPILGGAIQAATGKNTYFGTPLPNNSFGSNFLNQTLTGLPLYKVPQSLIMNETGPDATSQTSRAMTLAQYLGIPLKDPRWGQLHARGVDELNERYKNPAAVNELVQGY